MTATPLLAELTARAKAKAHTRTQTCPCGTATPTPTTLTHRPDATVVRHADTVAKAHAPHTRLSDLTPRLTTAAHLPGIFLPPLTPTPTTLHDRLVTFWPYGTPVDPNDPDAAPWEAAATLLAHLHRTPVPVPTPSHASAPIRIPTPTPAPLPTSSPSPTPTPTSTTPPAPTRTTPLPPMRGPAKAAQAMARLTGLTATAKPHPAAQPLLRAWHALPAWARAEAPMPDTTTLCHGDLHLGQLVRHPAPDGPWLLIDVDDLGTGVPAWDLARPAAWYACGLLPPEEWTRFLTAYRAHGGPAVPADGDPWPALDVPARALTVQTAARAVTKAVTDNRPLDEIELSVIDACGRMASVPPQLTPLTSK